MSGSLRGSARSSAATPATCWIDGRQDPEGVYQLNAQEISTIAAAMASVIGEIDGHGHGEGRRARSVLPAVIRGDVLRQVERRERR